MWQRDALRRLVLNGELYDEDISSLTEICKSAQGLAEQKETSALAKGHVPDKEAGSVPVSLVSIYHHRGVNALAEDQTLNFATGLTAVYGDNPANAEKYEDVPGFCKSATNQDVASHGWVLTPGRYVGAEEVEDDGEPFEEKMPRLVGELHAQFAESSKLEQAIKANLKGLGYAL